MTKQYKTDWVIMFFYFIALTYATITLLQHSMAGIILLPSHQWYAPNHKETAALSSAAEIQDLNILSSKTSVIGKKLFLQVLNYVFVGFSCQISPNITKQ